MTRELVKVFVYVRKGYDDVFDIAQTRMYRKFIQQAKEQNMEHKDRLESKPISLSALWPQFLCWESRKGSKR
jgi:hypothetical protein